MDVSLDLSLAHVPKTISEYLRDVSKVDDSKRKLSKLDDYVKRLEDELRKIEAFKRELPLCMLLLNDAIMRLKNETMQCQELKGIVEVKGNDSSKIGNGGSEKKNWMSSVQLWNNDADNINIDSKKQDSRSETKQRSEEDDDLSTCENPIQLCSYRSKGGAFMPFKAFSGFEAVRERKEEKEVMSQVTGLTLMTSPISELGCSNLMSKTNSNNQMKIMQNKPQQQQQYQQQPYKKQRRCWSPELHQRFIDALQQLGGSQVATPKQIRELMRVDGLTNDEVKSHLQKYRLHIRKLLPSSTPQAKGLWMAQDISKPSISQSNSPQGPFYGCGSAKDISSTIGGDSMEAEDDGKSESHNWNSRLHEGGEVNV